MQVVMQSSGIKVIKFDNATRAVLMDFCRSRIQWTTSFRRGRYVKKMHKVFAASNRFRTEFFFHRHDWEELKQHLANNFIPEEKMLIKYKRYKPTHSIDVTSASHYESRDYQIEIVDSALQPKHYSLVIPLQPGSGKTYIALKVSEEHKTRTGVVSKLKHVKQWRKDIKEQLGLTDKDILLINGKVPLIKLIKSAKEGTLTAKYILFSNSTLQVMLKKYELGDWHEYGVKPDDLLQLLGIGLNIVDEAHENLHLNFKLAMYLHVKKTLYLSGSLESEDEFVNKMSEIVYPTELRYNKRAWDKYIDVYALSYKHYRDDMVYQYNGNPSYNHGALEQWYLKNPKILANYFKMVGDLMYKNFVEGKKDGLKAVVFVSYVDFATALTKYLKSRFRHLDIKRYCATEGDSSEALYDSDIRVTTPESCGTGTDIPNLSFNLCLVNVSSMQRNTQIHGRTRKIKLYPEMNPVFMYVYAVDIDKHVAAHNKRFDLFEHKSKSIRCITSDYKI